MQVASVALTRRVCASACGLRAVPTAHIRARQTRIDPPPPPGRCVSCGCASCRTSGQHPVRLRCAPQTRAARSRRRRSSRSANLRSAARSHRSRRTHAAQRATRRCFRIRATTSNAAPTPARVRANPRFETCAAPKIRLRAHRRLNRFCARAHVATRALRTAARRGAQRDRTRRNFLKPHKTSDFFSRLEMRGRARGLACAPRRAPGRHGRDGRARSAAKNISPKVLTVEKSVIRFRASAAPADRE
jgi:hypothetical protein